MGYDMTIKTPLSGEEAERYAAARAVFHAAIEARDSSTSDTDRAAAQAKVTAAATALDAANVSYFRLNIWGMGRYRDAMATLGMLALDYQCPEFPDLPDGVDWDDVEAAENAEEGDTVKPEVAAYVKARAAHLAWHPEPTFGISVHKLGTNDGWLVTPEEITSALESYRTHSAEEVRVLLGGNTPESDYWFQWIAFLERAQGRGGFHVW